jgi:lipopolysaccharide heptosyltransferase I
MKENPKILIVKLSAIGDVVHSLPILHALRRKFPNAYIGWLVEDKAAEILIGNPLIDKVYVLPKKKWKSQGLNINTCNEFFEFINLLRNEKFDIAIDLQELFKSGILTFLSGAKRRIAHAKTREFADIFINEKLEAHDIFDPDKMVIGRYLEPAEYLGAPVDEVKFSLPPVSQETKNYIDGLLENIDKNKAIAVFAPATTWSSKHWPESYWSELLDKLSPNNNVIFIGSKQDINLVNRITAKTDPHNYLSLAGKTSLLELIELFNRTDIIIAPDTGPAYIANAVGKPVIIMISGATSYKRTGPIGEKHSALSAGISCQPCHKKQCQSKTSQMECMKKITPDAVFKIFSEKLTLISKNIVL